MTEISNIEYLYKIILTMCEDMFTDSFGVFGNWILTSLL